MAEKNIYLKRQVAADGMDSLVKSGVAEIELHNGDIVAIGAKKSDGTYVLTAPTASSKRLGIVYNADVVTEGRYRGLSDDPRDVVFKAGTVVNLYIPSKEDEVAITVATGYIKGTSKVLVPTAGGTGYMAKAAAADTDALVYTITDEKFVSVGNERIKTIEAVCTLA